MLNWIRSVAADALRLRRQATRDDRADHARRMSEAIAARDEARRLRMLAMVGQPAAEREPGLSYPQAKI